VLTDLRGELAALAAAFIWAGASVIYSGMGRQISPLMLNLVKGLVALALLVLTLVLWGELFPVVPLTSVGLLLLSGAIGIGLGDTVYFMSLNSLGARRSLVLESLAPPMAALLALTCLQETLSPWSWGGILLTVSGVTWVVAERMPVEFHAPIAPMWGVLFGMLAALAQATGVVLSRAALAGSDIDPLWSTCIRLAAGTLVLLIWLGLQRRSLRELAPLGSPRLLLLVSLTAFASTYVAIWLQQIAIKYAPAGIAQSLSATSPLFVLPMAIALGEKVSLRAILGVLVAIVGIWLLFQR